MEERLEQLLKSMENDDLLNNNLEQLLKNNIIFINDEIDAKLSSKVISQLLYLSNQDPDQKITMYIMSEGGEVHCFLAIYDIMQMIRNPVETICIGEASSGAAILLAAGSKGLRKATISSRVMIHQIQVEGTIEGSGTDVQNAVKELKKDKKRLTEILACHTGQSYEKVYRNCEKDKYMMADEALDYGLVDEIISPFKEIPKLKKRKMNKKAS